MEASLERGRLEGLDALRGIAALIVLVGHAGVLYGGASFPAYVLAVDFFFMLSGYIMARTYEHGFGSGLTPAAFVWMRYKRLWPVCAIGCTLILPLAVTAPNSQQFIAFNFFLLPTFTRNDLYPLNTPLWSIFFELFANVVHALVLYRIRLHLLIGALTVAYAIVTWVSGTFDLGATVATAPFGIFRVLLAYCIGVSLWRTWRDRPPFSVRPIIAAATLPLTVALISISPIGPFAALFVLIVCPLLIGAGITWNVGRLGSIAGAMSFPLYAIHFPMLLWGLTLGVPLALVCGGALSLAYVIARAPRHHGKFVPRPKAV